MLDRLDGALLGGCARRYASGRQDRRSRERFYSRARQREVGYSITYPPGHRPGSDLPLVIGLHAYGGNHRSALGRFGPARTLAMRPAGRPLPPMAVAAADGGGGYWNPHPHDDPMGMVLDELIPRCRRLGLGLGHRRIGTFGISMGGYGALLLAERYPDVFGAAAAVSPAIWTSYAQARAVNPGAYASAADFRADDAVTRAGALAGVAVRVAAGVSDPFYPGVRALAARLPAGRGGPLREGLPHRLVLRRSAPALHPVPSRPPVARRAFLMIVGSY